MTLCMKISKKIISDTLVDIIPLRRKYEIILYLVFQIKQKMSMHSFLSVHLTYEAEFIIASQCLSCFALPLTSIKIKMASVSWPLIASSCREVKNVSAICGQGVIIVDRSALKIPVRVHYVLSFYQVLSKTVQQFQRRSLEDLRLSQTSLTSSVYVPSKITLTPHLHTSLVEYVE